MTTDPDSTPAPPQPARAARPLPQQAGPAPVEATPVAPAAVSRAARPVPVASAARPVPVAAPAQPTVARPVPAPVRPVEPAEEQTRPEGLEALTPVEKTPVAVQELQDTPPQEVAAPAQVPQAADVPAPEVSAPVVETPAPVVEAPVPVVEATAPVVPAVSAPRPMPRPIPQPVAPSSPAPAAPAPISAGEILSPERPAEPHPPEAQTPDRLGWRPKKTPKPTKASKTPKITLDKGRASRAPAVALSSLSFLPTRQQRPENPGTPAVKRSLKLKALTPRQRMTYLGASAAGIVVLALLASTLLRSPDPVLTEPLPEFPSAATPGTPSTAPSATTGTPSTPSTSTSGAAVASTTATTPGATASATPSGSGTALSATPTPPGQNTGQRTPATTTVPPTVSEEVRAALVPPDPKLSRAFASKQDGTTAPRTSTSSDTTATTAPTRTTVVETSGSSPAPLTAPSTAAAPAVQIAPRDLPVFVQTRPVPNSTATSSTVLSATPPSASAPVRVIPITREAPPVVTPVTVLPASTVTLTPTPQPTASTSASASTPTSSTPTPAAEPVVVTSRPVPTTSATVTLPQTLPQDTVTYLGYVSSSDGPSVAIIRIGERDETVVAGQTIPGSEVKVTRVTPTTLTVKTEAGTRDVPLKVTP